MSLQHKTDLATVAQGRVISQYKGLPLFVGLLGAITAVIQEVEDAYWALFNAVLLDTATGIWLEYLGAIVGEAREGAVDNDYRVFIRARILANKSSGTIDEVLTIIALFPGLDPPDVFESADEYYPASMLIVLDPSLSFDVVVLNRMLRIVAKARPTGVRLMINSIVSPSAEADTFTFGDSGVAQPQIDALLGAGDSGNPATGGHLSSGNLA